MCLVAASGSKLVPIIVEKSINYPKALKSSINMITKTLLKNDNKKSQTDAILFNALSSSTCDDTVKNKEVLLKKTICLKEIL